VHCSQEEQVHCSREEQVHCSREEQTAGTGHNQEVEAAETRSGHAEEQLVQSAR